MMDFMSKSNGYLDQFLSDRYKAAKTKMAENAGGMKAKAAEMGQLASGNMPSPMKGGGQWKKEGSTRPMQPNEGNRYGESEGAMMRERRGENKEQRMKDKQQRQDSAAREGGMDYGQARANAAQENNRGYGSGKMEPKMQSAMAENPRENIKRQLGMGGIGERSAYQGFMG